MTIEIKKLYCSGYGYKKIAKELKLPIRKVIYSLIDLGYKDFMIFPNQEIIDSIIKDYKNINTAEISKKYHMSQYKVCAILKINNIKITPKGYHSNFENKINHNYFERIDTEEKAYWLGFLYADGYNDTNRCSVELCLKESDLNMIQKFKESLSSSYKISKKKTKLNNKIFFSYRHIIYSKKITNDLVNLGCYNKKSLILKFPTYKQVPKKLIHHFMRGYFDGDGCISGSKIMINGTKKFLNKYIKILRKNTNISEAESWSMDGKAHRWQHASKKDLYQIFNFLYKDSTIFLERKYNRFIELLP